MINVQLVTPLANVSLTEKWEDEDESVEEPFWFFITH